VADTTRNIGSAAAGASSSRYYLSKDARRGRGDVRLIGFPGLRAVPELRARRFSRATVMLGVPKLATGRYRLLACADDLRRVRESNERNNCRASKTTVKIRLNKPPVAAPVFVATVEDVSVPFDFSATDPDGDTLRYEVISGPLHGSVERHPAPPHLIYRPTVNTYGSDGLQMRVSDGRGGLTEASISITVQPIDDPPQLVLDQSKLFYNQPGSQRVDPSLTVSDPDDMPGASVSISTNFRAGEDVLSFSGQPGITGSYEASRGVLTLTGTATAGAYQEALRSVTYQNTAAVPTGATREITFSSGTERRSRGSRRIVLNAPVVTTSAGSAEHSLTGDSVPVDPGLAVSDADDGVLERAEVVITSGFVAGDDLAFVDQLGIDGTYFPDTGKLVLSGTRPLSDYREALRSVEFFAESGAGRRTITFTAEDEDNVGPPASRQVNVGP
jgi:hypothetical protein